MAYISNHGRDNGMKFPFLELPKKEIVMAYISNFRSDDEMKFPFLELPKKGILMAYISISGGDFGIKFPFLVISFLGITKKGIFDGLYKHFWERLWNRISKKGIF